MKAVEASGKTREVAMENALKELGVELYEVDKIEVLDEGNKGLFGFGARPVRVRLTVEHLEDDRAPARPRAGGGGGRGQRPERAPEGAQQRGDRGPRDSRGGQQQRGGQPREGRDDRGGDRNRPERPQQDAQQPQQSQQRQQRPGGGQQQGQQGQQPRQQQRQQPASGAQQGQRGQGQQQRGPRPERPQGQQQPRQQQPRPAPKPAAAEGANEGAPAKHVNVHEEALDAFRRAEQFEQFDSAVPVAPEDIEDTDVLEVADAAESGGEERPDEAFEPITDEQGQEAAGVLREMILKMGIEAEVTFVRTDDGAAKLDVRSQDSAMLIGRKGRTLGAMQYLVNRMIAQGDAAENTERIMIDVEGYVDRRREMLEDLARHFAGRVKESGRPARLKPLSPQERRIIHMTLRNDPEVRTASLGDSLYRTVVISPINARPGRPQGQGQGQGQGGGGGRGRGNRGGRGRGGGNGRRPGGPPRQRDTELDPGQLSD